MTWLSKLLKIKKIEIKINTETTIEPSKIYLNTILVWSGVFGLFIGMFQQNLNITIISALLIGVGIFSFAIRFKKSE